jgi:hypothetical protein
MNKVRGNLEGCLWTENLIDFSFKTTPKGKTPLPFPRQGAFFTPFFAHPLTLLLIGGRSLT